MQWEFCNVKHPQCIWGHMSCEHIAIILLDWYPLHTFNKILKMVSAAEDKQMTFIVHVYFIPEIYSGPVLPLVVWNTILIKNWLFSVSCLMWLCVTLSQLQFSNTCLKECGEKRCALRALLRLHSCFPLCSVITGLTPWSQFTWVLTVALVKEQIQSLHSPGWG